MRLFLIAPNYKSVLQFCSTRRQIASVSMFERIGRLAKLNPEELDRANKKLKDYSRKRVAERGVLQFRAAPETVLAVLDAAEKNKMSVGALLREWVQEKLTVENAYLKAPDLLERVTNLEEAVSILQKKLK